MGRKIARLEQALKVWGDVCYLLSKVGEAFPEETKYLLGITDKTGPLFHYSELSQHIIRESTKGNYDFKRFSFSEIVKGHLAETGSVPAHLFAWNHYSRRVYNLDKNLQTLLSATTLEGIYWEEIKWPFQSFVIELTDPIADNDGKLYDCIVVSEIGKITEAPIENNGKLFDFLILSTDLERYRPLDKKKYNKIFSRKNRDYQKIIHKFKHIALNLMKTFFLFIYPNSEELTPINKPFKASLREYRELEKNKRGILYQNLGFVLKDETEDEFNSFSIYDKANHLVASTCLFLSTLPAKKLPENNVQNIQETASDISPASICDAKKVFHIQCESELSRESQETVAEIIRSRISREKRPHWRRGHWRRIWGGKHDLSSPKIWIHPCLVNKEKLMPNSVPIASRTNLL